MAAWRDSSVQFTDPERAGLALTESVTRLSDRPDLVPDAVWDEAARHYDEQGLASLLLTIAVTNVSTGSMPAPARYQGPGADQDDLRDLPPGTTSTDGQLPLGRDRSDERLEQATDIDDTQALHQVADELLRLAAQRAPWGQRTERRRLEFTLSRGLCRSDRPLPGLGCDGRGV